jgi:hypothetical protein
VKHERELKGFAISIFLSVVSGEDDDKNYRKYKSATPACRQAGKRSLIAAMAFGKNKTKR